MAWKQALLFISLLIMLSGCATMPTGPNVAVLPAPGKPFEVFMADDAVCRLWAQQSIGGASPSQMGNQNLATGAVVGTAIGAALGVAIGAATGNAAAGAAIGAGTGLLGGTAMGSTAGGYTEYQLQRRYDFAYQQCMYAKGNQVPGVRPVRVSALPSPRPNVVAPPPNVVVVVPPRQATLEDIHFAVNKADIGADAAEILKNNVEWFRQNPGKAVRVEGNTDTTGTEKYNMSLGQKRADAARDYLIRLGIDATRLGTVSYGETQPVCSEKDHTCWAKERRAHFTPVK